MPDLLYECSWKKRVVSAAVKMCVGGKRLPCDDVKQGFTVQVDRKFDEFIANSLCTGEIYLRRLMNGSYVV